MWLYQTSLYCLIQVTLEELYNGSTRKIAIQRNVICQSCKGKGGKEVSGLIVMMLISFLEPEYFCIPTKPVLL